MTKFLPYSRQTIDQTDIDAVSRALEQEQITRGQRVQEFEKAICERVGAEYAVAFANGSSALRAACQAVDVCSFDTLVTTPNTFIATAVASLDFGAKCHLVDIDGYANMDIAKLEPAIFNGGSRGRQIFMPVHFAGVAVDMKALSAKIAQREAVVIEDASHALGSLYPDGTAVGSCAYSDMTIFSFHASKNIACGEGGMVTTNSVELYERLRQIRNSGMNANYEVERFSCNAHMSELHAALGLSQLQRLDLFGQNKQRLLALYRRELANVAGLTPLPEQADGRSHYHLFEVHMEFEVLGLERAQVIERMKERGIGVQYHYVPLYVHRAMKPYLRQGKEAFPAMQNHYAKGLSLPFFSSMQEEDVYRVVEALRQIVLYP